MKITFELIPVIWNCGDGCCSEHNMDYAIYVEGKQTHEGTFYNCYEEGGAELIKNLIVEIIEDEDFNILETPLEICRI